jgi:hypothetical protein
MAGSSEKGQEKGLQTGYEQKDVAKKGDIAKGYLKRRKKGGCNCGKKR